MGPLQRMRRRRQYPSDVAPIIDATERWSTCATELAVLERTLPSTDRYRLHHPSIVGEGSDVQGNGYAVSGP